MALISLDGRSNLLSRLASTNFEDRLIAARAYADYPSLPTDATAVPLLLRTLQDTNWAIRFYSVAALRRTEEPRQLIIRGLTQATNDPNMIVRFQATDALQRVFPEALSNALAPANLIFP